MEKQKSGPTMFCCNFSNSEFKTVLKTLPWCHFQESLVMNGASTGFVFGCLHLTQKLFFQVQHNLEFGALSVHLKKKPETFGGVIQQPKISRDFSGSWMEKDIVPGRNG